MDKNKMSEKNKLRMLMSICFVLVAVMLFGAMTVDASQYTEVPEGYTGIYSIEDIYAINNDLSGKYILMNDIDMSVDTAENGDWNIDGYGWTPILNFSGIFNGNGHRIIGMNIYGDMSSVDNYYFGLFGNVKNAQIYNLQLKDVNINIDYKGRATSIFVGGICGYASFSMQQTNFVNCCVNGNINIQSAGFVDVGGILGSTYTGSNTTANFKDCYNNSNITVSCKQALNCGGIVGKSGYPISITNCYNKGLIDGNSSYETSSYVCVGAIDGHSGGSTGGYNIANNYYLKNTATSNGEVVFGFGNTKTDSLCTKLLLTQFKLAKCFVGFDFNEVWEIDPYCDYPYPQLLSNPEIRVKSVTLERMPAKVKYEQGDELDLTDAAIRITYEDDTSALVPVNPDMVSGFNMNEIGNQTVTVAYRGVSTSYDITVLEVPVTSIKIKEASVNVYRGKKVKLNAVISPSNASNKNVVWTSSDMTIATVDANGNVTGKSKGKAIITATSSNGKTSISNVNVLVAGVDITLNKAELTMGIGKAATLKAQIIPLDSTDSVKWKSSDESVATVVDGKIYAEKAGKATITAYINGSINATCKVVVNNTPTTFSLAKSTYAYTGLQIKPSVTVKDNKGNTVATTNYTVTYGTNKAVGKGTVKITFKDNYAAAKTLSFKIAPKTTTIATPVIAADGITVKWTKNTTGSGYYIYRSVNGGTYTKVKTVTTNSTVSWKDTTAKTNGNKYQYKVIAYKTVSGTIYTSAASAIKTIYFVSRPTISSITNASGLKMLIKWARNAKASGYILQYSTSSSFTSPKNITVTGTTATLTKTIGSLVKGRIYYVRIRSYKTVGNTKYYSVWSATKSVKITK